MPRKSEKAEMIGYMKKNIVAYRQYKFMIKHLGKSLVEYGFEPGEVEFPSPTKAVVWYYLPWRSDKRVFVRASMNKVVWGVMDRNDKIINKVVTDMENETFDLDDIAEYAIKFYEVEYLEKMYKNPKRKK